MTNSTASTTATDRISVEIAWADWKADVPRSEAGPSIAKEFAECIEDGSYPATMRFEEHVQEKSPYYNGHESIIVSAPDAETMVEFYTAYCGGDREQALFELEGVIG